MNRPVQDEYMTVVCTVCEKERTVSLIDKDVSCEFCRQRRTILIRALLKEYPRWSIGFSKEIMFDWIEDKRLLAEITHAERLMLDTIIEKVDRIVQYHIHGERGKPKILGGQLENE